MLTKVAIKFSLLRKEQQQQKKTSLNQPKMAGFLVLTFKS